MLEDETRKKYIDTLLTRGGWVRGRDWIDEYPVGNLRADYALLGANGVPLGIIEAKRMGKPLSGAIGQASNYADILEQKHGVRPVIFVSNGTDTYIVNDDHYTVRKVSGIYSKRDLEKLHNVQAYRESLSEIHIDESIAGRYYQKEAVERVCEEFANKKRKALLVMATGSGKTRTVISLVDVLIRKGWVKNVLFLADRTALVSQAKRNFVEQLPHQSCSNLSEKSKERDFSARIIFSTYQTMVNCIDTVKSETGDILYTCGHFDLIICDEAHRSIYNKYKEIFTYFDSLLVGLTATPKDEVDKDTYGFFGLEKGIPTYSYELSQAVKDGYLVDFISVEVETKFLTQGIHYDELPDDEKEEYESMFENADTMPKEIDSKALNEWLFNRDTIKKVLNTVMERGIKVDYGTKIGKTIIFAKNQKHADMVHQIFREEYPHYSEDFCKVITYNDDHADESIDNFAMANNRPQVAISVDMLDTGIDVPSCVNLVFFKKVLSKAKFWQMVGRGTRNCPNLIDGNPKTHFYIFDFCGNFEFFRVNPHGKHVNAEVSLTQKLFQLKVGLVYTLQGLEYQTAELKPIRERLVNEVVNELAKLDRENFAVMQHLATLDRFNSVEKFQALTYDDTLSLDDISPLILCNDEDIQAQRFDALMYCIELSNLLGKPHKKAHADLVKKAKALTKLGSIPDVAKQSGTIYTIANTPESLTTATTHDFERIREALRGLMQYIKAEGSSYESHFTDDILGVKENPSQLESNDFIDYKHKVNTYIRKNQDNPSIQKLKTNQPLTHEDISQLEGILWGEVGTREDYQREYGNKSLGVLVREIVGLDMHTAKEQFAKYLTNAQLTSKQIFFINQIVEYIVHNGVMLDLSVMQKAPFIDVGNISEIFVDMSLWLEIRKTIEQINQNALV